MKIMHISDLHITSPNFVPEWGENLLEYINSIAPDILVITGDLTNEGHFYEYEKAELYLKRMNCKNVLIVPGNHDARNEGFTVFEDLFGTRYPVFNEDCVLVVGIDSSQPDIDDGHIGRAVYPSLSEKLKGKAEVKIAALHHHLIPIPGTGRERHIPADAGDVLKLFCDLGVNFVLSGHRHKSWIWKLNETYFITCGTSTSRRLKGKSYPSFNVLEIKKDRVTLQEINVIDGSSREIFTSGE